jgi:hypothetical protein
MARTIEITLTIKPDKQSIAETRMAIGSIDDSIAAVAASFSKLVPSLRQSTGQFVALDKAGQLDVSSIKRAASEVNKLASNAGQAQQELSQIKPVDNSVKAAASSPKAQPLQQTIEVDTSPAEAGLKKMATLADTVVSSFDPLQDSLKQAAKQFAGLAKSGQFDADDIQLVAGELVRLGDRAEQAKKQLDQAEAGLEGLQGEELVAQQKYVAALTKEYSSLSKQIKTIPQAFEEGGLKRERLVKKITKAELEGVERRQRAEKKALVKITRDEKKALDKKVAAVKKANDKAETDRLRSIKKIAQAEEKEREISNSASLSYDVGRSSAQKRFAGFGDVDTALQTFSGALGGVAGDQLRSLGDVAAVTEQVGLLGESAVVMGGKLAQGNVAIKNFVTNLAGGFAALVPALGATGATVAAIAVPLAAVAAVAVGAGLAFHELTASTRAAAKAAKKAVEQQAQAIKESANITLALAKGDTSEAFRVAASAIDEVTKAHVVLSDHLKITEQARKAVEEENNKIGWAGLWDEFTVSEAENKLKNNKDKLNDAMDTATQAEKTLTTMLEELVEHGLAPNVEAARKLVEAEEKKAKATQDTTSVSDAATQVEQERRRKIDQTKQAIANLNSQQEKLLTSYDRQMTLQSEDRSLASSRELEDWQETVADSASRITDMQEESNQRLADLQQQSLADASAAIKKARKDEIDLRANMQETIADQQEKFAADSVKREKDFNKQRIRAQQDLQESLWAGQLSNDILSITQAKRQSEKESSRRLEDFSEEEQERRQQLSDSITQLRENGQERLSEIRAQLAEEQASIKQALAERTQEELSSIAERVQAERESQAEAVAQRDKRLARQAEDESIADARRQEALDLQLSEIASKRDIELAALADTKEAIASKGQAELQAIQLAATGVKSLAAAASQLGSNQQHAQSTSGTPIRSNRLPASQRVHGDKKNQRLRPFAEGGIVPANTQILAEFEADRDYAELVLPLNSRSLQQVMPSLQAAPSYNITFEAGAFAASTTITEADVREAILQAIAAQNRGIAAAKKGRNTA